MCKINVDLYVQATTYPSLSITSHPNGTYTGTGASSFSTQLSHPNFSAPQTSIPQTTLSSLPPYSTTSFHSTLGPLTSIPQPALSFSSVQSSFTTSGSTYSTVGTNAFGTSGVSSGMNFVYSLAVCICSFCAKEKHFFFVLFQQELHRQACYKQ